MRTWAAVAAIAMLGCAPGAAAAAALERGRPFVAHSDNFQLLPGVSAIAGTDALGVRSAMDQIGAGPSSQLAIRGRYVLYLRGQQPGNAALLRVGMVDVHPAAVNTRTGAIAVLLGTIEVRLRNFDDRKAVAATHKLRIESSFPQLQKVFLKVPARRDILDATAALAADPRVQSAAVEMLENVHTAK